MLKAGQSKQMSRVGDEEFDQILKMTKESRVEGFSLNQLSRILATTWLCRPGKDRTNVVVSSRKGFRGAWLKFA